MELCDTNTLLKSKTPVYQRGPESRRLERKMISDIGRAYADPGCLGGYFCVIYVLQLLINRSIYLVTALIVFR